MKRMIAFLLSFALAFSMLPLSAVAAEVLDEEITSMLPENVANESVETDNLTVLAEGTSFADALKCMVYDKGVVGQRVEMGSAHYAMLMGWDESGIIVMDANGGAYNVSTQRNQIRMNVKYTYEKLSTYSQITLRQNPSLNSTDYPESRILAYYQEIYELFLKWKKYKTGSDETPPFLTTTGESCGCADSDCEKCNMTYLMPALEEAEQNGVLNLGKARGARHPCASCYAFCWFAANYIFGNDKAPEVMSLSRDDYSAYLENIQKSYSSFAFASNGGTGSMTSLSAAPGQIFTIPKSGFSYTGFEVQGWNLQRSDGLWLTSRGTFASEEDAKALGYAYFFSDFQYMFEESWIEGDDCSFTFWPIWKQSESDSATEEELRAELEKGHSRINFVGNIILDKDLLIPEGVTLTISSGSAITVPQGANVTNNGELVIGEKYSEAKAILKINGNFENNGRLSIQDGDLLNSSTLNNNGSLGVYGSSDGVAIVINSGTIANKGDIRVSGAQDDGFDAQLSNSGIFTQTEQGSFVQEFGRVTGIPAAYMQVSTNARTTADILELLDAGYQTLSIYVPNDLTISQNLTLPQNSSFHFEGNVLTIPTDVRMTIACASYCELSREGQYGTVNVLGELYCNGETEMWENGKLNVSGELVVNKSLVMQGDLRILDGGKLTNNGSIRNYGRVIDLQLVEASQLQNNGYIAGINEQLNSSNVSVSGTEYSYDGKKNLTAEEADGILKSNGIMADKVSVIWQAGLQHPEDGTDATVTINNYEGIWYLLGYGSHGSGWGMAEICYEPTADLWFGNRWLYDYAVVLATDDDATDPLSHEFEGGICIHCHQTLEQLDEMAEGTVKVEATSQSGINAQSVTIVGAKLNGAVDENKDIVLQIGAPENENLEISKDYDADVTVLFSMTLENVAGTDPLQVPVKITLPIPASIDPQRAVILHYNADGTVRQTIQPTISQDNQYASFLLTGFCDFAITQKHEHSFENGYCSCGASNLYDVTRLYSDIRYRTAIKIADELKATWGVEKFDTIVVASGEDFPDALAGTYLASVVKAPIVLNRAKGGYSFVATYIQENLAKNGKIYMLGGTAALDEKVEANLKKITPNVVRLAGNDRYATCLEILKEAAKYETPSEVMICSGVSYTDTLVASATTNPVMLVYGGASMLNQNQKAYLAGKSHTIVGDENTVGTKIATALGKASTSNGRITGDSCVTTSIAVAKSYFTAPTTAVLASGKDYPDGLCGGVLAIAKQAPLLLVADQDAAIADYIANSNIQTGIVVGGKAVVSRDSVTTIFGVVEPEEEQT